MRIGKKRRTARAVIINWTCVYMFVILFALTIGLYFAGRTTVATMNMALKSGQTMIVNACVKNVIPYIENEQQESLWHAAFCYIAGFDIKKPQTILYSQLSSIKTAQAINEKNEAAQSTQENKEAEKPSEDEDEGEKFPIVQTSSVVGSFSGSGKNKTVYINNETSFEIDINKMLEEKLSITKKDGPMVLIVHTHTTESYTPSGKQTYSPSESTRTQDKNYNVVRVGEVIKEELVKNKINAIHDTTINDYPSYNGSYKKTLGIIEDYLKKYPSIQVVLDVHRDGMTKQDGTKMKVCADVGGENSAQVMVLCGSSEGGLKHDNWRENLKLGLRIQQELTEKYPTLARPLQLVKERYNQHATKGSLILEVGTDGNTLEEALVCAKYTARAIASVLGEL
ncbi:MAG: stage II sporulation protein P [Ruminococcaceae bacterium]|nr:stage II sporulation protein P [Oscillospiraceae bacterium]